MYEPEIKNTIKNKDGSYEIYFENSLPSWHEFDLILKKLVSEHQCTIIEEIDMITDKDAILKLGNVSFILRNCYMFGNYIYSTNENDIELLEQIVKKVIESIKLEIEKE